MFGSNMIEIAIGLCFIFLFASLICTAARESIESLMRTRAMDLERGIRELLSDADGKGFAKQLFDHPQIYSLFSGQYNPASLRPKEDGTRYMAWGERANLPSYIPAANFASALIDIVHRGAVKEGADASGSAAREEKPLTIEALRASIAANLPNERLRRAVLSAVDLAEGDIEKVKTNLETWFNSSMDRVTGWYKRRTQRILLVMGVLIAVVLNIDAIHIAKRLSADKTLREAVVKQADKIVGLPSPGTTKDEQGQPKQGEVKQGQAKQGDTKQGATKQGETKQGETKQGETKQGETEQGEAKQDEAAQLRNLQTRSFDQLRGQLEEIGLPIGWTPMMPQLQSCLKADKQTPGGNAKQPANKQSDNNNQQARSQPSDCKTIDLDIYVGAQIALGWIITALAVMLGAPFWFDILSKVMTLRSSLKPPTSGPDKDGKDKNSNDGSPLASTTALLTALGKLAPGGAHAPPPKPPEPKSPSSGTPSATA